MAKLVDAGNPTTCINKINVSTRDGANPTKAIGVALKTNEWEVFEQIAAEVDMKRGALLSYAVRWFIKQYQQGNVPTTTKKSLTGI